MAVGLLFVRAADPARAGDTPPPDHPARGAPADDGIASSHDTTAATDAAAQIDEILTRLQARSDGVKDISCRVVLLEDDKLNLAQRAKTGRILFKVAEPNPKWLVHFETTKADGQSYKQEWYLFDGSWLFEVQERIAQVTKREIARAGEPIDFFDLEKSPFPLPFGQKKAAILRNFNVTLVDPVHGDPPDTDHLVCVPKPDSTLARKYDKLEFFVRHGLNLPVRIIATKNGGYEVTTVDFPRLNNSSINAGVTDKDFAEPAAWKGFKRIEEPLQRSE